MIHNNHSNSFRKREKAIVIWFSTVFTEISNFSATCLLDNPSILLNSNISRQRSGNRSTAS